MDTPTVFADFHNADPRGRLRLNCRGTAEDLARHRLELSDGMRLVLSDDELEADGRVLFSAEENLWVAEIDWDAIRPSGGEAAGPIADR
ncbi:hypothetical protein [Tautonia plasticadhaerens]|uniref:Uncharacterized protein n=1 Tax=Tautonia plasticadhaerens TaxID=2527974 RepID=A0A518H2L5_9BACT|nr:hypothetical protein [Tautonia plasticadhaerens]QDV35091.1 hypothetical protein ElP_29930 [Tautonia plasticadhaerens]